MSLITPLAPTLDVERIACGWVPVCRADQIVPDCGAAVLLGHHPIAIFHLSPLDRHGDPEWFAVDHRDPATGAPVMARGLVGSMGDEAVVASPLGKERYLLASGTNAEGSGPGLATFPIRVVDGLVEVLEFNRRKHR